VKNTFWMSVYSKECTRKILYFIIITGIIIIIIIIMQHTNNKELNWIFLLGSATCVVWPVKIDGN
jgi:uncharacterized membrane protein